LASNGLGISVAFDPWQRQQAETAGDQIEAKEHNEDETDRKDQRANQRLIGLYRTGDGEARRRGEDAARQPAADDQIHRRQSKLGPPGIDHGGGDVRGLYVIHVPAPMHRARRNALPK
jgi:hypothetical protein